MGFDRQVFEKEGIYGAFEADRDDLTLHAPNKRPFSKIGQRAFLFVPDQSASV